MKKILLSMAALSALSVAAPAMAQQRGYVDTRIDARIGELQSRLQAGVQQGSISRQEAQTLRVQLRELTRLERQYARDGLSRGERQDLQQRVQSLRQQIRTAEMSGGGRYDRDGRWGDRDSDRFERDCPPGLEKRGNGCVPPGQVGRDGRWEDRRDDRDGRWEDRRDDRDDRWDDRRDDRDDRDGRWDGDRDDRGGWSGGGLRVGQRVSGGLGAVPYQYRSQYRDGGGVYHRSDGRNVYRIDARTDIVLQVYVLNR